MDSPSATSSAPADDPNLCPDMEPLYPEANNLADEAALVAEFPYLDGTVYLLRWDQEPTYFTVIECSPAEARGSRRLDLARRGKGATGGTIPTLVMAW